jgi:hypothetical protein
MKVFKYKFLFNFKINTIHIHQMRNNYICSKIQNEYNFLNLILND